MASSASSACSCSEVGGWVCSCVLSEWVFPPRSRYIRHDFSSIRVVTLLGVSGQRPSPPDRLHSLGQGVGAAPPSHPKDPLSGLLHGDQGGQLVGVLRIELIPELVDKRCHVSGLVTDNTKFSLCVALQSGYVIFQFLCRDATLCLVFCVPVC